MADNKRRLFNLSELDDWKVVGDDPDVRGWKFVDDNHDRLGYIQELIVDPEKGQTRYLNVRLEPEFAHSDGERHILVPVGLARVHSENDEVLLHGINRETLLACPVYKGPEVTLDYEHALVEKINPEPGHVARNPADFYNYEHFNADSFYGPRRANVSEGHYNR